MRSNLHRLILVASLGLLVGPAGCERQKSGLRSGEKIISAKDGRISWYDVPPDSLAAERAPNELTAASNTLPKGTRVRITNHANSKVVVVRITDDGIDRKDVVIDLCKEAAEQIGMVGRGIVDARIEVLGSEK